MKIYFDACCVNRLTDDQSQPRIRAESEAIEDILRRVRLGLCLWLGSEALTVELEANPDSQRREENSSLLRLAAGSIPMTTQVLNRARELQGAGYQAFDAMHLASAESAGVDVLLTTDDRFIKRAARGLGAPIILVLNPLSWSKEDIS